MLWIGTNANTYINDPKGIVWWNCNVGGVSDSVDSEYFSQMVGDGMLYNLVAHRIRDVFDGTSNTLHVGELTGGETGSEKGWEWVSGVFFSTAFGINGPGTIPGEGVYIRQGGRDSFSSYHPPGWLLFLVCRRQHAIDFGEHGRDRTGRPDHKGRRRGFFDKRIVGSLMILQTTSQHSDLYNCPAREAMSALLLARKKKTTKKQPGVVVQGPSYTSRPRQTTQP